MVEATTQTSNEHYLNASSEVLCGIFVSITIFVALASIIAIAIIVYCKLKSRPLHDRTMANQCDANESQHNDKENGPTTGHQ